MSLANCLVRGAVSGFIATLPMTATIYAGKALGRFFRPPSREFDYGGGTAFLYRELPNESTLVVKAALAFPEVADQ